MSNTTFDRFQPLIAKAARDPAFRDALVNTPLEAARSEGLALDGEDVINFNGFKDALLRFGGNPALNADDARFWAAGLLLSANKPPLSVLSWRMVVR
jgi:hypothetical protein